jgi:hypothetical protein
MTAGLYFTLTVRPFFFFLMNTIDCLLIPCSFHCIPYLCTCTIDIITCEFNLSNPAVTYMPWARTVNLGRIWICTFGDKVIVDKDGSKLGECPKLVGNTCNWDDHGIGSTGD